MEQLFLSPEHRPGQIYLLTGPLEYTRERVIELTVLGAPSGLVRHIVGGNRFDYTEITFRLAQVVPTQYYFFLDNHLLLARAETIIPLLQLMRDTPASEGLILVTDLFSSFDDEAVSKKKTQEIFAEMMENLRRLAKVAPVVITARPSKRMPELFSALQRAATAIETPESELTFALWPTDKTDALMGRTLEPITILIRTQLDKLRKFASALMDKSEKAELLIMLDEVDQNIPSMVAADRVLPIGLVATAMALKLRLLIKRLATKLARLAKRQKDQQGKLEDLFARVQILESQVSNSVDE